MTREDFKILFDAHFDSIRNYVFYKSGNTDLATDIAQDTFLKVWEKQFSTTHKNIKSLLYKIAGDLYISHYRRQKVEKKYTEQYQFDIHAETPEEELRYKELNLKFQNILAGMTEKKRVVFLMSRMENLTYSEIALHLGISVKTVEKRMSEALTLMKDALICTLLLWFILQYLI